MGAFGSIDVPARNVNDFRKALQDREAKLVNAKARRDKILLDIGKANAAVDAGDRRARLELGGLNEQNVEAGRLILSIEREVAESRKRVDMAENQSAAVALKQAQSDAVAVAKDKWFAVSCPDGRVVRHQHSSLEALQKVLRPGYSIAGQVFGTNADGTGGFVSAPGAPSMMKALLAAFGDELIAFLAERGIGGNPVKGCFAVEWQGVNVMTGQIIKYSEPVPFHKAMPGSKSIVIWKRVDDDGDGTEYLAPANRSLKDRVDSESILRAQAREPAKPFPAYR